MVSAWGGNASGQLGTTTDQSSAVPTPVPGLPPTITTVSAGTGFSLAVSSDGSVWSWGRNDCGQLGQGTVSASNPTPAQVVQIRGIVAVAAGGEHALALRGDGTVFAWGCGGSGQLGNGAGASSSTPVPVPLVGNVTAVAAGGAFSMALGGDGGVWTWGANDAGQLGDGTTSPALLPQRISLPTSMSGISAGRQHSLAVNLLGTVYAWGDNTVGELGDGCRESMATTAVVAMGTGQASGIAASAADSFVLRDDGSVLATGADTYGQLGDGQGGPSACTFRTVPGPTGITQVAGGGDHALGVDTQLRVWSWGDDRQSEVGTLAAPTSCSCRAPLTVVGAIATQVAAGADHSLAVAPAPSSGSSG